MINEIEELSLDGFQVVKANMFVHLPRKGEATCTVWPTRISFNQYALKLLNSCEMVRIEVNPTNKCLLVVPVTSSDKDSIRWTKGQKDVTTRNMESRAFGNQLYQSWGLDRDFVYRSTGRLVTAKGKVMLLFDFKTAENWQSRKAVSNGE